MLSTDQFERDLADLTPDLFEQFVHALVLKDHPDAQRLKAPDFGADVIDDPARKSPHVWQVKHYRLPGDINWTQCKESLDRAVGKWRPGEVTFVFPRDLTGGAQQAFTKHLASRHQGLPVKPWTASGLNAALEGHPGIRHSYFRHRTDVLHQVLKAARLTEKPADGPGFLEHGLDLAELLDELDPNFAYDLSSRSVGTPRASWDQPPFMTARVQGDSGESVIAAWTKPEAAASDAAWSFTDDETGAEARRVVHSALARGEAVELSQGISVRADPAPKAIKALLDESQSDAAGELRLTVKPADETIPLTVSIESTPGPAYQLDFALRSAPPKPGDEGSWVGLSSGVILYLGFRHRDAEKVRLLFSPTMDMGTSAGSNAAAVATLVDLLSKPLTLNSPLVGEGVSLDLRPIVADEDLARLKQLGEIYGALIEIEARAGVVLRIPEVISGEDATAAANLALLFRDGRATGRSELKTTLHVSAEQAAAVAMRLTDSRQVVVPFEQQLLEQTIRHGWSRITFERLTVTVPAPRPEGPIGLEVVAHGEVEVRLIEAPLPSDVTLNLATGGWTTAVV